MINLDFEKELFENGNKIIAGFDEAGRGALAGPIVGACVLLKYEDLENHKDFLSQINDSKKLTPKKREELYEKIMQNFHGAVSFVKNDTIDKIGIQKANVIVIEKSANKYIDSIDIAFIDYIGGFKKYTSGIFKEYMTIIDGDAKHVSIAMASIVAKVYRDRLMTKFSEEFREYNFSKHKGYGTKEHFAKIKKFGLCEIHRKSYCKNIVLE